MFLDDRIFHSKNLGYLTRKSTGIFYARKQEEGKLMYSKAVWKVCGESPWRRQEWVDRSTRKILHDTKES